MGLERDYQIKFLLLSKNPSITCFTEQELKKRDVVAYLLFADGMLILRSQIARRVNYANKAMLKEKWERSIAI